MYKNSYQIDSYSIIKVYYDSKGKIVCHSDHVTPFDNSELNLKLLLSEMLKATRLPALSDNDLFK